MTADPTTADLYVAHRARLVRYASRIVGSRSVAEDVVQEAYLRFTVQAGGAEADPVLEPVRYLYRIVRNLALDWLRRPRHPLASEIGDDLLTGVAAASPTPEADTMWRQEVELMEQALASLPERTRMAFEMHRLGGYTLQAVADRLGISVTRAHQLVTDAMTRCAARLDQDRDGD